jgi:flavin reductase (DIM6/NTAB) family NADH-FMN oxidoreductase RutF
VVGDRRSGAFAVNLLAADQVALAHLFASKDPDKLARLGHERGAVGAPLLSGTVATFKCLLVTTAPSATHRVLVGRVMAFASDPSRDPLVFFRSRLLEGPPAGAASSPSDRGPASNGG